jgi:hypothetical protein
MGGLISDTDCFESFYRSCVKRRDYVREHTHAREPSGDRGIRSGSSLAARWEESFANARISAFPFGLNANHRKILRACLKE